MILELFNRASEDDLGLRSRSQYWLLLLGHKNFRERTKFHDLTGNGVWENVNVFQVFISTAPVTVTLGESHSNWYGLKGLSTKYRCVKFQSRRHTTNITHTEKPDQARSRGES